MEALECLQRAFEVAINYAVYNKKAKTNILKLRYDTELLVTGQKTKKTLSEKYLEEKAKEKTFTKRKPPQTKKKRSNKQVYAMESATDKKGIPVYWILVAFSFIVAFIVVLAMIL